MLRTSLVLFLAALTMGPLWGCGSNRDSGGDQTAGQTPEQVIASADFVGSTKCLSCHGDKQNWGHTLHKAVLRKVGEFSDHQANTEAFYAGSMNAGLNWLTTGTADGSGVGSTEIFFSHDGSAWSAAGTAGAGPGVDKFSATINEAAGSYTLVLADLAGAPIAPDKNFPVLLTYGGEGNYKQRYVVTGIGASKHISPIQYNDKGIGVDQWVHYHAERWYDPTDNEFLEPADKDAFDGNCAGCHFTGYTLARNAGGDEVADAVDDPNGALDFDGDGTLDEINIGCEACHGAGSVHVSTLNPAYIINPADLVPAQANMVCGQCHIRGKSIDTFTDHFAEASTASPARSPFPARLAADGTVMKFRPGLDDLATFYSFDSADGSGAGNFASQYWGGEPSGGTFVASKQHHQQYIDILQGPHGPDKSYDPTCFSCHDMHNNADPGRHQIVTSVTEDNIVVRTANDDNTLCLTCHAGHGPFADLTVEEVAAVYLNGEFNVEVANVKELVGAHTQHYYDPEDQDDSGGSSRCSKCHLPKTAKSALKYDIHAHTFNIIEPDATKATESAVDANDGVPNSCNGCHTTASDAELTDLQDAFDAKFTNASNPYFDQWATSGHADYSGEPFNYWNEDGDISTSCAKCHSKDGFRDFALDNSVDAAARLGTVVSCGTCHTVGQSPDLYIDANTLWDDSTTYTALEPVTFPSGDTQTLANSSNLCMACHQGRESGLSIATATANTVEQAPADYTSYDFINRHYFAAAAIMFGTDVTAGFEYAGRTYDGATAWPGAHGTLTTCTGCHMRGSFDHTFEPLITDCSGCHDDITAFDQLNLPGGGDADYDGDLVAESFQSEIDGFAGDGISKAKGTLLTAIQTYASTVLLSPSPIVYMPGSYPYWFKDNGAGGGIAGNGIPDGGEAGFGNRYRDFDIQLLQAAYNFHSAQDPCGDIHNYQYVIQTLYDSMDDLDDGVQNDSATGNRP